MGAVYRAKDRTLGREVVVKRLRAIADAGARGIDRFLQEARAIAALNHRNIVTVFKLGEDDAGPYIVMEYLRGGDVQQRIVAEGKLDLSTALSIIRDVGQALSYAHRKSVVHRDIKPSNILLTEDGTPKLVDFGLAQIGRESELSMTGYGMGTLSYMAPEQRRDAKHADHRTDIYSLGVMMYELVAGRVPFPSGDVGYHHLHTEPESPRNVNPKIPEALEAIILKAMKKNKEERYGTAAELIEDLDKVPV